MRRFLMLLSGIFLIIYHCKAQQTIIHFNVKNKLVPIGKSLYFYEDMTGKLTLNELLAPERKIFFVPSKKQVPNFANTHSAIWCRFTLLNELNETCLLEIANASLHHLELYLPDSTGHFRVSETGFLLPFASREYQINTFLFKLSESKSQKPTTFYLKIQSEGTMILPVRLGTAGSFLTSHHKIDIFYSIYFGVVLFIVFFYFFIYLLLRDKAYLFYISYIFTFGVLNASLGLGYTFEFLWPRLPALNYYQQVWLGLGCLSIIFFTSSFLETRRNLPRLHKGLYFFMGWSVIIILLSLSGNYLLSARLGQLLSFLLAVYLLFLGLLCHFKGIWQTRFYILAWGFFLIGSLVFILTITGVLPYNFLTSNALVMGSMLEALLLSFSLSDKIRSFRLSKENAEAEKRKLIESQNTALEQAVQERTEEIARQNEEITAQNEELLQIQEEIETQRDVLSQQNEHLKEARKVVENYNLILESEVKNRTEELREANETLVQYNQQLEQFAFITAHNLRSPVARILGLGNLIDLQSVDQGETRMIVHQLVVATRQLDEIIKDLNIILEANKSQNGLLKTIVLSEAVEKVKSMLETELTQSQASVLTDFSETDTLFTLSPYFDSILFNLLSNALKYRHADRPPVINLRSSLSDQFVILHVTDNGLGIDLNQYGKKLFSPYKRFHFHVEGKGLGLYLVKTQMTALGGKIEISSQPGQGTTFNLYFPNPKS